MPRPLRLPLLTALILLGAGLASRASAAELESVRPPAAEPGALPEPARPAKPRRERVMSDDLAATLAVGMPRYSPPKPVEKKLAEEPADAREAEKPKNGIIRLPDYVVREQLPTVFKERELATPSGKADLGMQRYAGLKFGPFSSWNRPIALAMYQEQERLDSMSELADAARTARRAGDKATADFISKQSQETYLRRGDFNQSYGLGPK